MELFDAINSRSSAARLGEPGPTWQHFRGPDGNVYELVASDT